MNINKIFILKGESADFIPSENESICIQICIQTFMHLNCKAMKILTKTYIFLGPDPLSHGSARTIFNSPSHFLI